MLLAIDAYLVDSRSKKKKTTQRKQNIVVHLKKVNDCILLTIAEKYGQGKKSKASYQ